jgi:preprotein translocase subunit SecF
MKFAPGAVIALIHDVTITAGVFSFFGLEFNLQIVAALLTLIGFSINDTIVVYDRIRDNIKKIARHDMTYIINASINQTFSRTILTSLTVLIITTCMLFLGGRIIRDFSLALTVGIIVGTYSSIFIASPITILLDRLLLKKKL